MTTPQPTRKNNKKDIKEMFLDYLTVDIDIPFDIMFDIMDFVRQHIAYWEELSGIPIKAWSLYPSKNYNTHLAIKLSRPLNYVDKIHAEICLGSDILRGWYTWARWKMWRTKSDFLFTDKIKDRKEVKANIETLMIIDTYIPIPEPLYREMERLSLRKGLSIQDMILDAIYLYVKSQS
jgi:nicotinic acid mononucleotide adenylyltransferase